MKKIVLFIFIFFLVVSIPTVAKQNNVYYWVITDIYKNNNIYYLEMLRVSVKEKNVQGLQLIVDTKKLKSLKNILFDRTVPDNLLITQCIKSTSKWGNIAIDNFINKYTKTPYKKFLHTKNKDIFKISDDNINKIKKWPWYYIFTNVKQLKHNYKVKLIVIHKDRNSFETIERTLSVTNLLLFRDYLTGFSIAKPEHIIDRCFKSLESSLSLSIKNYARRIHYRGNYVPPTKDEILQILANNLSNGELPHLGYYDENTLKRIFKLFVKDKNISQKMIHKLNGKKYNFSISLVNPQNYYEFFGLKPKNNFKVLKISNNEESAYISMSTKKGNFLKLIKVQ